MPCKLVLRFRTTLRILVFTLLLPLPLAACDSVEERVAKHHARGEALLAEGVPEKAILEFLNALKLDDGHAPSHFQVGLILEERGDLQGAFGRFRKVVELRPTHVDARLKLARYLLMSGAPDEADSQMGDILKLDPTRGDVQALNAAIRLQKNDLEGARKALDMALAVDPENVDAALVEANYLLRTATPAAALARIDRALSTHEANLPLHLTRLQILENIDDQAGIGAQLTTMIETFPGELKFRQARAQWAARTEDPATVAADLRALVEAQPGNLDAVTDLIRFLRRQEGDEAARAELARLAAEPGAPPELELMLAQFDVETGNKAEAIAHLRGLIERGGESANLARVALARLLYAEGRIADADVLIGEVLAEDPNNVEALLLRIARLIDENRLEEAVQEVRRALNEAPEDVRLLVLAARAHELSGNLDLASDRFAKAVRLERYAPAIVERYVQFLLRAGRAATAETVLAEAVAQNPGQAKLYDLLGFLRARLSDWPGAEQAARELVKLDPERARQLRAAILIGQERFDEGVDLLRELPLDEQRRTASIAAIVESYVREGRMGEAEAFLDGLLAENPEHLVALGLRGNLHAAAGDFDAAEAKYRAILAIDPANAGAHSALSRLFGLRGDEQAAEDQLLAGLQASPDNLILLARLGELQTDKGRYDEAIETYRKLYGFVPDSILVVNNLASLLSDHRADDPEAVDYAYQIAGRLRDLDGPAYQDTYGWTRYLKGEYEEALGALSSAAEALPDNPWVLYHLGMIQAALGKNAEARKSLENALANSAGTEIPPEDEIRATLAKLQDG